MPKYILLIDCNNFFVSCERVFRPELENKPVAVLSNNDGCIVARSQEVKDLGVPMGAPIFKYRELLEKNNVVLFSSNFSLYADMSQRVMNALRELVDKVEVYSVDEAFLEMEAQSEAKMIQEALSIRTKIGDWLGIPVSIGIAPTKTLAKVAAEVAKKNPHYCGVKSLCEKKERARILATFPVGDIWGVGRGYAKKLWRYRVDTAGQLIAKSDLWIKPHISHHDMIY